MSFQNMKFDSTWSLAAIDLYVYIFVCECTCESEGVMFEACISSR